MLYYVLSNAKTAVTTTCRDANLFSSSQSTVCIRDLEKFNLVMVLILESNQF